MAVYPEGYSVLAQCLKQLREFGVKVAISLCHLGMADQFIRSNITYPCLFGQADYESRREASRLANIPRDGDAMFMSLPPGQFVFLEAQGVPSRQEPARRAGRTVGGPDGEEGELGA